MSGLSSDELPGVVDHLVWCVPELNAGISAFEDLTGVRAAIGGSHPGIGTHNALVSLGPRTYLEIIAPDPAQQQYRRPRVFRLDDIDRPTLVTWAAASARVAELAGTAFGDGQHLGDSRTLSRMRPDGVLLHWTMTDPYVEIDGGIVPFLINWGDTPHPGEGAPLGVSIRELRAWHPDSEGVSGKLAKLDIELRVEVAGAPRLAAILDSPAGRVELV